MDEMNKTHEDFLTVIQNSQSIIYNYKINYFS